MANKIAAYLFLFMIISSTAALASEENLISPSHLMEKIESSKQPEEKARFIIIDINPSSYKTEHVEFAVPMRPDDFEKHKKALFSYDEVIIYCHCPATEASSVAAERLRDMGFENVSLLNFTKWKEENYPIVCKREEEWVPGISAEMLSGRIEEGRCYLYDLREAEDYDKGSLPGAVNISMSKLIKGDYYRTLPKDGVIIVYCYSGYLSRIAVRELLTKGVRNVYDLTGGIEEWEKRKK